MTTIRESPDEAHLSADKLARAAAEIERRGSGPRDLDGLMLLKGPR